MNLKDNFDMADFLETAKTCTGDVFFHSGEGDIINLKSLLSTHVLASLAHKTELFKNARVVCTRDEDYAKFADFCQ